MATENRREWRALCQAVSVEQDSGRLRELLAELMQVMGGPLSDPTTETPLLTPAAR